MMNINISKTKVFGTYSIMLGTSDCLPCAERPQLTEGRCYLPRIDSISSVYNAIYSSCCLDYEISKAESIKERTGNSDFKGKGRANYTYGEINLQSMIHIFDIIYGHKADNILHNNDGNKGIFYDLGSGVGVPVIMAAIIHPYFEKCYGIEILNSLHNIAMTLKSSWDKNQCALHESKNQFKPKIEFYNDSILNIVELSAGGGVDWTKNGDIYFINSTCFDDELILALQDLFIRHSKKGCYVVTLSKQLEETHFELIKEIRLDMSWLEKCNIHVYYAYKCCFLMFLFYELTHTSQFFCCCCYFCCRGNADVFIHMLKF